MINVTPFLKKQAIIQEALPWYVVTKVIECSKIKQKGYNQRSQDIFYVKFCQNRDNKGNFREKKR